MSVSLLTKGRSKGVCCVLGFQDVEGLRDVYGRHVAAELMGQCSHKAILRLESDATASWASRIIGEREEVELRQSSNRTAGGLIARSVGESEQRVKREAVLASEFMTLTPTSPKTGLTGYYLTPHLGAYCTQQSFDELLGSAPSPNRKVPDLVARDLEEDGELLDWNDDDYARLGLRADRVPAQEVGRPRLRLLKRNQWPVPDEKVEGVA